MSNRAEETLDKQLINRIVDLERQVRELSTPQKMGGDVFELIRFPALPTLAAVAGPVTLIPNQSVMFYADYYSDIPALWNFQVSVTVDTNDSDHVAFFATVPANATDFLRVSHFIDLFHSDDNIPSGPNVGRAVRRVCVRVENYDSVNHNYWTHFAGYLPKLTAEGTTA